MTFHNRDYAFVSEAENHSLLTLFNTHFETVTADSPERVRMAQKLRHQVYCIENPLEHENREGIETDTFDSHAAHSLLVYRPSEIPVGTVRLILPLADETAPSFPMQTVLDADALREFKKIPLHAAAEVSRFSISRQSRRLMETHDPDQKDLLSNTGPLMRLGLIQALVRMSLQNNVTHWCAVMEQSLLRMLAAMAIHFVPIGPVVEYHGLRQPCFCVLPKMLDDVKRHRPAFWSVLTSGGALTA
jgi:N-acyl amino acid synthase of PEP-CTERM/exosortase system